MMTVAAATAVVSNIARMLKTSTNVHTDDGLRPFKFHVSIDLRVYMHDSYAKIIVIEFISKHLYPSRISFCFKFDVDGVR